MNRLNDPTYSGFLESIKDPIKGLELLVGVEVDISPLNYTYVYGGIFEFLKLNREVAIDFIPLITTLAIISGNRDVVVQTRRAYLHCTYKSYIKEFDALNWEIVKLYKAMQEYK